jgi:hypothetical protein
MEGSLGGGCFGSARRAFIAHRRVGGGGFSTGVERSGGLLRGGGRGPALVVGAGLRGRGGGRPKLYGTVGPFHRWGVTEPMGNRDTGGLSRPIDHLGNNLPLAPEGGRFLSSRSSCLGRLGLSGATSNGQREFSAWENRSGFYVFVFGASPPLAGGHGSIFLCVAPFFRGGGFPGIETSSERRLV